MIRFLAFGLMILLTTNLSSKADNSAQTLGSINDPMVAAQERLIRAKGGFATVKEQERAIKDLKSAIKLSLKAAKLRAKAEKLQAKADALKNKAAQHAITRGLYISNPSLPGATPPQPDATRRSARAAPIPGRPINIIVPEQETVSYDQGFYPSPPVPDN